MGRRFEKATLSVSLIFALGILCAPALAANWVCGDGTCDGWVYIDLAYKQSQVISMDLVDYNVTNQGLMRACGCTVNASKAYVCGACSYTMLLSINSSWTQWIPFANSSSIQLYYNGPRVPVFVKGLKMLSEFTNESNYMNMDALGQNSHIFVGVGENPDNCPQDCTAEVGMTPSCSDSDGGLDYYTKGGVEESGQAIGVYHKAYDFCSDTATLVEMSCNGTHVPKTDTVFICPNGCQNGACLPPTTCPASIELTSQNTTYHVDENATITAIIKDSNGNPIPNAAINAIGVLNGNTLLMSSQGSQYTDSAGRYQYSRWVNNYTIGAFNFTVYSVVNNCAVKTNSIFLTFAPKVATPVTPTCTDTDGGVNQAVTGTATDSNSASTDYCFNNTVLYEYSCASNGTTQRTATVCSYGCQNGACKPQPVTPQPQETCGNGRCASTENCSSCPVDCGQCQPVVQPHENETPIIPEPQQPTKSCIKGCVCNSTSVVCPELEHDIQTVVSDISNRISQITISKPSENSIVITAGNVQVSTTENLTIRDAKIYIETPFGRNQVTVLPDNAVAKATEITHIVSIELRNEFTGETTKPVYTIKGTKNANILFIIPVTLNITTKVNGDDGSVMSVDKPWWSFLAW